MIRRWLGLLGRRPQKTGARRALDPDLKQKMLDELATSRMVVSDGFDVVPRFRVFLADGDQILHAPMYDDMQHRLERLSVVKAFMVWKQAGGFIHAAETIEPNAIVCALITRDGVLAVYQLITRDSTRKPLGHVAFGEIMPTEQIDPLLISMLPNPAERLTDEQEREALRLFGPGGKFEVKPIIH